jgi:hypothetical protein
MSPNHEVGTMQTPTDPFVAYVDEVYREKIAGFQLEHEKTRRSEFQQVILGILEAREDDGFFVLGDIRYRLNPKGKGGDEDWRCRDINRLLTRYREDRPIKDAQRSAQRAIEHAQQEAENAHWLARLALFISGVALLSSLVSSIADSPNAWKVLTSLFASWFGSDTAARELDI